MELKVTGLANETDFKNPENVIFLIVFNNGLLRVPTTKEGADAIIRAKLAPHVGHDPDREASPPEPHPYANGSGDSDSDDDEDGAPAGEDGVPSA